MSHARLVVTLCVSFSACFVAARARAADRTVNVSTEAQLRAAVNDLRAGDTVLIADGTYTLTDTLYVNTGSVTFASQSGDRSKVIVQGDVMSATANIGILFRVAASNVTIKDLTLQRCRWHLIQVVGESNADNIAVKNCVLRDAYEQLLKVSKNAATPNVNADNGLVENCDFGYTAGIGPQYYIGGIDAHGSANWVVRTNTFANIISPSGSVAEHAVHFWDGSANNLVERNTIVNCDRGIGFGLDGSGNSGGIIRNNMIYHAANKGAFADTAIALTESPNTKVYNNTIFMEHDFPWAIEYRYASTSGVLIQNNVTNKTIQSRDGGTGTVNTNITNAQSAWFVNPAAGNLHLASSVASLVDKGAAVAGLTDDFDGDARPQGAGIDLGADERASSTPPAPDTAPPSVPAGLTATALSSSQIALAWTASSDNVGVAGYKIFRGGTQVATSTATTYQDSGLTAKTLYTYTVAAYDAAGNTSAASNSASATTLEDAGGKPLIQKSDFAYLGAFALPQGDFGGSRFGYGGNGVTAYNDPVSGKKTLYMGGHAWNPEQIAQVEVPASFAKTHDYSKMPVARVLQNFTDISEGKIGTISNSNAVIFGMLPFNGRLIVAGSNWYDAAGTQVNSHGVSGFDLSVKGDFKGYFPMQCVANPRSVGGYMTTIPAEWRSAFGGPALTGKGGMSIISASSCGPCATVFNPDDVAEKNPIPGTTLAFYPLDHPLADPTSKNEVYNLTSAFGGILFPAGSRSVMIVGSHGMGRYGYGPGTDDPALDGVPTEGGEWCYDPANHSKGGHAYPYRYQVWAYDANDLLQVKSGAKKPWEMRPYAVFSLDEMDDTGSASIRGAGYDPDTGRLFITTNFGEEGYVEVYQVNVPGSPAPQPPQIVTEPADATVNVGQTATFRVVADGSAPLSYQWKKNGVNIDGATAASYTTPATTMADHGATFQVMVSNVAGSATSRAAKLTVQDLPANHAPVASAQSVTTPEQTAKTITLVATDTDGDPLTYLVVAGPYHGTLSGTGRTKTYTPASGYSSGDGFTFKANDGKADSNVAAVTITVTENKPPDVRITSPAEGAVFHEFTDVPLAAEASDPDGEVAKVEYLRGQMKLGEAVAAPWAWTWTSPAPGSYTLHAEAIDKKGKRGSSADLHLIVNARPIAHAAATPVSGKAPLTVAFDGSGSSDPDGAIAAFAWDFGDGAYAAVAKPSHVYAKAGTFTATLTVTDNRGASRQDQVAIKVSPSSETIAAPANLTARLTQGVTLQWTDASNNEEGFYIERRAVYSASWYRIGQTGANQASYQDWAGSYIYLYRVQAFNATKGLTSAYSNEALPAFGRGGGVRDPGLRW